MRGVFVFFSLTCLFSCKNTTTLPNSSGSLSEIVFVVEDFLWEEEAKKTVNEIFSQPIIGLNQEESEYRVIQISFSEFNNVLKKHKSIIILSETEESKTKENKWAKNQLVVQLKWEKDIEKTKTQLIKIKSIFDVNELKILRRKAKEQSNKEAEKIAQKNFGIEVVIPQSYQILENKDSFFWATYNPKDKEEIKHILVFKIKTLTNNIYNDVLMKTDSVFFEHLLGAPKNSYVKIEPQYSPYFKHNMFRGLWKLENGFMGGPFILKLHKINKEVIVTVGLVFSPNTRKRNHIKQFEAIL